MGFFDVVNVYGFLFAVILLIPDVLYAKTYKIDRSIFDNRAMLYIERIGKYCSLFLMGINIGVLEEGFTSPLMKNFWLAAVSLMTAICVVLWIICFKKTSKAASNILTVITSIIFILSGLLQVKTLLLTFGVVYLIGQMYVSRKYLAAKSKQD